MLTLLLWKNLIHDQIRFAIAIAGVAFAAFLMTLQADLLYGFTTAASRVIKATNGELWIMARGVPCFDYGATLSESAGKRIWGVPGVAQVGRVASGFTVLQTANGHRQAVLLVGMDDRVAGKVPIPVNLSLNHVSVKDSASIDETDFHLLRTFQVPTTVEIGKARMNVNHVATGFPSFLGSPYVFTSFHDARRYLQIPNEAVMFLIVGVQPGADSRRVQALIRQRLPELDVLSQDEFTKQARLFWLIQTGAGGALSLAAILGFLIGLAVVSQTIYAATIEHLDEYATMKALGASNRGIRYVVLGQAYLCGALGMALGFSAVSPAVHLAKEMITWIAAPAWIYGVVAIALWLLCSIAALLAAQPAVAVEPARVFRA